MKTIILIHGAWHGAWCWNKVISLIREREVNAIAPEIFWDIDNVHLSQNLTIHSYIDSLCDSITKQQKPITLVAHSMGGMIISQLAESIPDFIDSLIYVSGFMLKNGQCVNDTKHLMSDSLIQQNLKLSSDKKSLFIPEAALHDGFYADCNSNDINFAIPRLRPQPLSSFFVPVQLTQENFGAVPRIYIECLQDIAIPLSAQRAMYNEVGCDHIYSLDSSHSPFFSQAESLAALLINIQPRKP